MFDRVLNTPCSLLPFFEVTHIGVKKNEHSFVSCIGIWDNRITGSFGLMSIQVSKKGTSTTYKRCFRGHHQISPVILSEFKRTNHQKTIQSYNFKGNRS